MLDLTTGSMLYR